VGGGVAIGVAMLMRAEDEIKTKEVREIYVEIIKEQNRPRPDLPKPT
jgi:hypothetical protein